jgi:hypothetical protein
MTHDSHKERRFGAPPNFQRIPLSSFDIGVLHHTLSFHNIQTGEIFSLEKFKEIFKSLPKEEQDIIHAYFGTRNQFPMFLLRNRFEVKEEDLP